MEQTGGPAPPPLVSDRPGTSAATLTAAVPAPVEPETAAASASTSTTLGLAQFQQMLVDAIRDPTIRAAVLPGASTSATSGPGEFTLMHIAVKKFFLQFSTVSVKLEFERETPRMGFPRESISLKS